MLCCASSEGDLPSLHRSRGETSVEEVKPRAEQPTSEWINRRDARQWPRSLDPTK